MMGGFFGRDPFGFDMFGDASDPFSLAGPSLFAATAQPHTAYVNSSFILSYQNTELYATDL